jgi:CheY-like chemotaxis protein
MTTTILLVEDDPDVREAVAETLQENGYAVIAAENGAEALELLDAATSLPALILLDLMMPVMDGWAFREAQRKHPRHAKIPVVALTAHGDFKGFDAAMHLRKPVSLDALLETVRRFSGGATA